jgi:hypothetical protein
MTLAQIRKKPALLPTTKEEMRARGWDALDILIITGDAYVDRRRRSDPRRAISGTRLRSA